MGPSGGTSRWRGKSRMLTGALVLLSGVAATGLLRQRLQEHFAETTRYEDLYYLPPPQWLKALSLGHRAALADLIWIRALLYFGEELRQEGAVRHVFRYGEAMVRLDPDFRRVYRWVAMAATYHTGQVSLEMTQRAARFVRRGAERFPDDGRLAWETGALLVYELAPWFEREGHEEAARRAREEGASFLATAARLGAGPPWLAMANATLFRRLGKMELAAAHLEEMLALTRDPSERERIAARLNAMRDALDVEARHRFLQQLRDVHRREYPWMPLDLYLLLGPRRIPTPGERHPAPSPRESGG